MTEREMEDLIWEYPERFLNEPLQKFERQSVSRIGRSDLIFTDRIGRLLVMELKLGTLQRDAISQVIDYFGVVKERFPDKSIELMVVANSIPNPRRLACQQYNIEPIEISQKKFRDVAESVGYAFKSESETVNTVSQAPTPRLDRFVMETATPNDFSRPAVTEKAWCFWRGKDNRSYFLAFVNAKGSCSMRRFEANAGTFLGREYKSGEYQENFEEYLRSGRILSVSRQPNLERDCKHRLPDHVMSELKRQVA